MKFDPNRCPKCGEPPRSMTATMVCAVPLANIGGEQYELRELEIRKIASVRKIVDPILLECGGGHCWTATREV